MPAHWINQPNAAHEGREAEIIAPERLIMAGSLKSYMLSLAVCALAAQPAAAQSSIVPSGYYDTELAEAVRALAEASVPPAAQVDVAPASAMGEPTDHALAAERYDDRLETFNRLMFTVNDALDMAVLKPTASLYRIITPSALREGISNVIANASSPVTLVNDLLQGEGERAKITLVRFTINSTLGMGGVMDVAAQQGYTGHTEDFDQTMAVYGIKSGPYIVLPLFGPMTVRHALGRVVDAATTPTTWLLMDASTVESIAPTMAQTVTSRETALDQIDGLRQTSPDYYAAVRELYFRYREAEIRNGKIDLEELDDIPNVSE